MKAKHTPGPWMFGIRGDKNPIEKPFDYYGPGYYDNPVIFGSDGSEVAGCDEYMIFNTEADVRLIVAAPDLLEALQLCEGNISSLLASAHPKVYGEWLRVVSEAIAKATGEKS
jgi:hypothetical protein